MPVNLSIKNVPNPLAERLRHRAERHHRSLQGELMAILEEVLVEPQRPSAADVLSRVRQLGVSTADEATARIRADRNAR